MIDLYGGATPNVFKVSIALEELGLDYRFHAVDITRGAQFDPAFLAICPNNKIPAIVDQDPADGGEPFPMFESGAILVYLAEKAGRLIPQDARGRARVLQWTMWQMAGQGPMLGQLGHFRHYASERIAYAYHRYWTEAKRLYKVLDTQLEGREFIVDDYSIADIACWPWIAFRHHHDIDLADYPNVACWFEAVAARPAVRRAVDLDAIPDPLILDEDARSILFPLQA
ncbi:glutathione S-transferase N-terminal domain-containing protein [Sphingomonas sp. ID0503]|uniref:glutathione S-transferase N-terminal domain-containing protein n=1 Tax=Sphingomonas sp. ID0503 TaxID=3399691 RepID=UPI003AFB0E62